MLNVIIAEACFNYDLKNLCVLTDGSDYYILFTMTSYFLMTAIFLKGYY